MPLDRNFDINTSDSRQYATTSSEKDKDIDRQVLPNYVKSYVRNSAGARMWHTDPRMLKEYSENIFVSSFIDQIAKDASKSDWTVVDSDTDDVDNDTKEFLSSAHPNMSWSDLIEATVRELLSTGNAFWVKHRYKDSEDIAEIVIPPSDQMFVVTDDNGMVDGYVQKYQKSTANVIDADDVVHFEWASEAGKVYAESPISMASSIIEILDELTEKEILDLREGAQSGVLTIEETDMSNDNMSAFIDDLTKKNKGERQEMSVMQGSADWISLSSNYSDLQILDRYKQHIESLSTVFKVSPSYVGFSFADSGGIGQGAARREARQNHTQGVNTVLQQIEDRINLDVIPELNEDSEFKFDKTDEDSIAQVEYYSKLGDAINKLSDAGVDVDIDDDAIESVSETSDSVEQSDTSYTERQKELIDKIGSDSLSSAIESLESTTDTRADALEQCQHILSGTMSKSTYYSWLDECDLR